MELYFDYHYKIVFRLAIGNKLLTFMNKYDDKTLLFFAYRIQ